MTVVNTWEDLRRLLRDNPEMYQAASDYIHQLEEQRIQAEEAAEAEAAKAEKEADRD